jgi:hypothetical protein
VRRLIVVIRAKELVNNARCSLPFLSPHYLFMCAEGGDLGKQRLYYPWSAHIKQVRIGPVRNLSV